MENSLDVDLLGGGGSVTPICVRFGRDNEIAFALEDGDELLRCTQDSILRWKPTNRQDHSQELQHCLDLQIRTGDGPHVLRLRCRTEEAYTSLQRLLKGDVVPFGSIKSCKATSFVPQESLRDKVKGTSPSPSVEEKVITELKRMNEERAKRKIKKSNKSGQTLRRAVDDKMKSSKNMKGKDDGATVLKLLRSFGTRHRTASDAVEETKREQHQETPLQTDANLGFDTQSSWNISTTPGQEPDASEQVCTEEDKTKRDSLRVSLDKLRKGAAESPSVRHEVESVRGKAEILDMENARLETANRELQQTVSEMEARKKSDKKIIQTLKDANEDICAKFDTLSNDLRQSKNALSEIEKQYSATRRNLEALEIEKKQWVSQTELSMKKQQCIEEDFKNAQQKREELDQRCQKLQNELDDVQAAHTDLKIMFEKEQQDKQRTEDELHQVEPQIEHLSTLLAKKESALRELKSDEQKRADSVAEALDKIENAEHERDLATKREAEMRHQLEILSQKISDERITITKELQSQWQLKLDDAAQAAQNHETECRKLRTEAMSAEMKIQELAHEKCLLEKRIAQLTSAMTSSQICCSLTGISVKSVAELEKVQRLELERQSALDDLKNLKINYDSFKNSSEADISSLRTELGLLQRRLHEEHQAKSAVASEASQLRLDLEKSQELFRTERQNNIGRVNQLQLQLTSLKQKHQTQIKALDFGGIQTLEEMERRVEEAVALIDEKKSLQQKWSEEANRIATQLDAFAEQHEQQIASLKTAAEEAKLQCAATKAEMQRCRKNEGELKRHLRSALYAKKRLEEELVALDRDYRYLSTTFDEGSQELAKLRIALKETERERNSYGLRYEALRRKTKNNNS